VITHAHGDHLRPSLARICADRRSIAVAPPTWTEATIEAADYGAVIDLDGVRVSFHPAGHILGSAQLRVEHHGEVWVASGDYKRADDPTCTPFEPQRCHTFITEATFALPVFRWDPPSQTVTEILCLVG
jgi:putative mRNA 3-end processing factor